MSELAKKRVHWKEYNGEELIHDEDVDVLTSADAVTFDDGETMQYKYNQGQFVSPSDMGVKSNLNTTNKSTLVDAINEVKTAVASTESSIDNFMNRVTPISLGGTGATTDSEALANLGGASTETYTATISTSWTGSSAPYTQTVTVIGITGTDNPVVDLVLDSDTDIALNQLEAWGCVSKIETDTDSITVTCLEDKPTTAIPIQLKVVR